MDAGVAGPIVEIPQSRSLKWYEHLWLQALLAIILGGAVGAEWPETGESMKPLGDALIKDLARPNLSNHTLWCLGRLGAKAQGKLGQPFLIGQKLQHLGGKLGILQASGENFIAALLALGSIA